MKQIRIFFILIAISFFCFSCYTKEDKSIDLSREAAMKLDKNLFDESIILCTEALDLWPKNIEAFYMRAGAYVSIQEYELAMADYNKLIELDPLHADAYFGRGNLILYMGGTRDEACIDWKKAEELGKANMHDRTKFCP